MSILECHESSAWQTGYAHPNHKCCKLVTWLADIKILFQFWEEPNYHTLHFEN